MTYHKVKIAKLSKAQILKLLKGKRIRIKGGGIHEIHLTEHQKHLFDKLKNGKALTIQFDEHQAEHNGEGIGRFFKNIGKKYPKVLTKRLVKRI